MDFFTQVFDNHILWISIFACFLAQFIKIFTGKGRVVEFSRIFMSGGMPSSHSSFVTSLSTVIGIQKGFDSVEFVICVVFALIVMYDASGVRRAVGKQAAILNKIVEDLQNKKHIEHETLKELIGHTPKEVILGAILGIVVGAIMA
ncbi:divergent PAP2 family protein [Terrisporobacter petrolearius]|uniref:divergent PAP2 family protein n=1 Tax=Terrisporobacter petrolearius TaxID=1460447 RepID=UPI001D15F5A4|nr:divergent PAP2 family protein [Terrisporobacter petrolearius]MCC3865326.1 divergent PAP2 family protein [Terrisporobacter petrolearius]